MPLVLLECVTKHEDVIEVYMDESSNVLPQHYSHKLLECRRGIAIPLLHNLTQECAEDSVVPQEQQTKDAVVPVDIGDIKVRVVGDVADAHWCMRTMSYLGVAAHAAQLQCHIRKNR